MCITDFGRANFARQNGLSLVELIVSIVVLSVGLAALLIPLYTVTRHSADPMVTKQTVALAEGLLEEIELKPFALGFPGPYTCANRAQFDSVQDYAGFTTGGAGMCGADGQLVANMGGYNATVAVTPQALAGIPAAQAYLITVTVTGPNGNKVSLSGIRTNYF